MNRREILRSGAAVAATAAFANPAVAQPAPPPRKISLDAYSRTLHWLRTPAEVAEACHEIGNTSIDLTIRPYPGHVNPDNVKTELPAFVNGLKGGGIRVSMIAPNIADADSPGAEAILDAASQLGIKHYWWGTYRYDETKPYWPQLDALKPRVEKLSRLNEKYGMKAMAHPRGGAGSVSGAFYDLLYILKNFDPRWVSYQYDTGQLIQARDEDVILQLRLGAPYIGGFVWKDEVIELATAPNPDAPFLPAGGRRGPPADGAGLAPGAAAAPAGAGRRAAPTEPSRWRSRQVPIGTGLVNVKLICQTLKEIGFDGPMECEPEWPQIDGAGQGDDKITIPRDQLIALLKRDYTTVQTALVSTGLA